MTCVQPSPRKPSITNADQPQQNAKTMRLYEITEECPPAELREMLIGGKPIAIEESCIALIRSLPEKKRKNYLKTNHIPLKNLSRFMQSLSREMTGELSTIKDSKLKKLNLPLMVPSGIGLLKVPDEKATNLIVVSHGQWHGVIFCSEVADKPASIIKFKKAKNGDIAGIGYLKDDREMPLLNTLSIVKREGFLAMV